jgi:putative Mg2+ transporter-C (MgtC) family protein
MLSELTILFRLVLAAVLSGMIGFEREFHGRAAGFRTHILLCVGSTLVMITSIHIFEVYYSRVPCDPARIAAGVVTGIGFLGAGAIMRSRASIRGLTTAASLWVVAGIGLGVGSGLYMGSIETAALTIITLMVFSRLEHAMIRKDWYRTIAVELKEGVEQLKAVREVLSEYRSDITDFEVERGSDPANIVVKLGVKLYETRCANQIIEDIGALNGVKYVKWEAD